MAQRQDTGDGSRGADPSGVPLGGIGTGSIEMGLDGRFRNITINNNRDVQSRIRVSGGGFLALRATQKGRVYARILQVDGALPFEAAGLPAPYVAGDHLSWRGLYPCAYYLLNDPHSPLDVQWTCFSPVIPYDLAASTIPVVFFLLSVANHTDAPFAVSTAVNWENLCGCTRGQFPEDRGGIRPFSTMPQANAEVFSLKDRRHRERRRLPRYAAWTTAFTRRT